MGVKEEEEPVGADQGDGCSIDAQHRSIELAKVEVKPNIQYCYLFLACDSRVSNSTSKALSDSWGEIMSSPVSRSSRCLSITSIGGTFDQ
jgi:hypothetical protein